jgi:alpha-beta hydrolase superfamily lysophospholipase
MTHERVFTDSHEVEVFSRWCEIESPTGVVVISHGASEHSGRYDRFARALNRAGLPAVTVDHRGHGRTAQTTSAIMGAGGGQAVVDDLHEFNEAAALGQSGVRVDLTLYDGARHELLNEINREEVTSDVIRWTRDLV